MGYGKSVSETIRNPDTEEIGDMMNTETFRK
jgi:hypothetical protein